SSVPAGPVSLAHDPPAYAGAAQQPPLLPGRRPAEARADDGHGFVRIRPQEQDAIPGFTGGPPLAGHTGLQSKQTMRGVGVIAASATRLPRCRTPAAGGPPSPSGGRRRARRRCLAGPPRPRRAAPPSAPGGGTSPSAARPAGKLGSAARHTSGSG